VVIADAETDDDLQCIAATVRESGPRTLLVGSGALGAAIAREMPRGEEPIADERLGDCRRVLVLCGSANPRSHEQLRYLAERAGIAVISYVVGSTDHTSVGAAVATSLRLHGVAAVQFAIPHGVLADSDSAARIQRSVGEWALSSIGRLAPDLVVLTGGETAWTVCRTIGGAWLDVITELVPGIVLSKLNTREHGSVLVATKPGGFGSKESLFRALQREMK